MNIYRLRGCRKCGGDLARDDGDWICLQCGSYFYVGLYREVGMLTNRLADPPGDSGCKRSPSVPSKHSGSRLAKVVSLRFVARTAISGTGPSVAAFR